VAYDYSQDRADLAAEIKEHGALMWIRRGGADYPFYGIRRDVLAREADGATVKITDQAVLAPAEGLEITPTTTDKLVDGAVWTVVKVSPIKPGPVVLGYTLFVRK
jgi:hypothetical protein